MKKDKKLWLEDDCTGGLPGHEDVHMAWKRLFGTDLKFEERTAFIDHGDCIEWQFGPISVLNVHGAYYEIERNTNEEG